jgi:hypothetical protein
MVMMKAHARTATPFGSRASGAQHDSYRSQTLPRTNMVMGGGVEENVGLRGNRRSSDMAKWFLFLKLARTIYIV